MEIPFAKYHALGNDFLVVQLPRSPGRKKWGLAKSMCDRHTGVGADGVACLSPSVVAEHRIDIYNADGGWAEMSGNGIRIAGVWASMSDKRQSHLTFETAAGIRIVELENLPGDVTSVAVIIGEPSFDVASLPMKYARPRCINGKVRIGARSIAMICLSVGNPHVVIPVENYTFDWQELGRKIETSKQFPRGTNVEFVKVHSRRKLQVMEWERGVGATGSSGTGAAAALAAMVVSGRADRKGSIQFPAGVLRVEWFETDNTIKLTGPVIYVMKGLFRAPKL